MTQQLLNRASVCAGLQQVIGEGVTEGVLSDVFGGTGLPHTALDGPLYTVRIPWGSRCPTCAAYVHLHVGPHDQKPTTREQP